MTIDDFIYFNKLTTNTINTNNFDLLNDYLSDYNCDPIVLDSVLKINKIDSSVCNKLTNKIKKNINIYNKDKKNE